MAIFFTADLHLNHKNIIKYSSRPYADVDEMNEAIIANWNAVVTPADLVYLLGDVAFQHPKKAVSLLNRLNGTIHLVRGNHDGNLLDTEECRKRFAKVSDLMEIRVPDSDARNGRQLVVLCHFPMLTWNKAHHGAWHLHGHSHGTLKTCDTCSQARRMDVGMDTNGCKPYTYEQIKAVMTSKQFVQTDHHNENTAE